VCGFASTSACFVYGPSVDASQPAAATLRDFPVGAVSAGDAGHITPYVDGGLRPDAGPVDGGSVDAGPRDAGPPPYLPLLGPSGTPWGNSYAGPHAAPFQSIGSPVSHLDPAFHLEVVSGGLAVLTSDLRANTLAVDLATNTQRWSVQGIDALGESSLVSDGQRVCGVTSGSLGTLARVVCLSAADGSVAWTASSRQTFAAGLDLAIRHGVLYLAPTHGETSSGIQAFALDTGQLLFEQVLRPHHRPLVFAGNRVVVEGAYCTQTSTNCIEALDERTGQVVATAPVPIQLLNGNPIGGQASFLWAKDGKPCFRYLHDATSYDVVMFDAATDAFVDASSAFASLNTDALTGGMELRGWSDALPDGSVYGIAEAPSGQQSFCRWDSNTNRSVWCVPGHLSPYTRMQAFPDYVLVGDSPTQELPVATGVVPGGKNDVAFCAERWCFSVTGNYAEVQP
jgi:hypothetical protein